LLDDILRLWPNGGIQVQEPAPQVLPDLAAALTFEEVIGRLALNLLGKAKAAPAEMHLSREILAGLFERPEQKERWESLARRVRAEQDRESQVQNAFQAQVSSEALDSWRQGLKTFHKSPLLSVSGLKRFFRRRFRARLEMR
ncbi:MAG: hypothetical protein JRI54_13250, partial [Deltaproteobacteria bacterium]|nr:hypothetical protein [Deltaproteobacteria bacterium]